jgi:hypothetical protein
MKNNLLKIKTLCTNCLDPMVCEWPEKMNWQGTEVSAQEYMGNALRTNYIKICCDKCLDEMQDVDMENMIMEMI